MFIPTVALGAIGGLFGALFNTIILKATAFRGNKEQTTMHRDRARRSATTKERRTKTNTLRRVHLKKDNTSFGGTRILSTHYSCCVFLLSLRFPYAAQAPTSSRTALASCSSPWGLRWCTSRPCWSFPLTSIVCARTAVRTSFFGIFFACR